MSGSEDDQDAELAAAFEAEFGQAPEVLGFSPGRLNLIGEHTDYNAGFALPMPIPLGLRAAIRPRDDGLFRARSVPMDERAEIRLDALEAAETAEAPGWVRQSATLVRSARSLGLGVDGLDLLIDGDLPPGRGLSSSAAFANAILVALESLAGRELDALIAAEFLREVETRARGVGAGLLDPLAIRGAPVGTALFIDFDAVTIQTLALPEELALILIDPGIPHDLERSPYAVRVGECLRARIAMSEALGRIEATSLRAFDMEDVEALDNKEDEIDPLLHRRARHVISENERTVLAATRLEEGDIAAFGRLVDESHRSLSEDYEASRPEIDELRDEVRKIEGVLGVRLVGGGFGGALMIVAGREDEAAIRAELSARGQQLRL